jgi:hypothetical protein
MDFRLIHPLFGQIYRYSGVFTTRLPAAPEPALDAGRRLD